MEDDTVEDTVNNLSEKDFLLHFISIYRDLPVLWKVKSKEYMDKNERAAAIRKITNLLKVCRLTITEEDVKNKINILRTSFRREKNKIQKSRLSGSATDDVYIPTLWYFKELEFLDDQMDEELGTNTISETLGSPQQSQPELSMQPSTSTQSSVKSKKKKTDDNLQLDLMILAKEHFKRPESESGVIARNWAFKLERMSVDQRRLAEKFVNEILFEGELGTLHRNSVKITVNDATPPWSYSPVQTQYTGSPSPLTPLPTVSPISPAPSQFSETSSPIHDTQSTTSQTLSKEHATLSNTQHSVVIEYLPSEMNNIPDSQPPLIHDTRPTISQTLSTEHATLSNAQHSLIIEYPPSQMNNIPDSQPPLLPEINMNNLTTETEDDTAARYLKKLYAL